MVQHEKAARKDVQPVNPKYISVRNAEAVVGQGYRWCRDTAHALGVRVVSIGRKRLIPAEQFFAALEEQREAEPEQDAATPADATASVLAQLGLEVVR